MQTQSKVWALPASLESSSTYRWACIWFVFITSFSLSSVFVSGMVRSASSSGDRIVSLRQVCRTTSRSVILKHSRECWALPLLRRLLIGTTLLSMLARNVVCKLFFHCVDALRRFRHVDRSHLFQGRSGEVFGRVLLHTTASKVHHWRPTCIAYLDKLRRNFGLHLSWLALVLPWEQLLLILSAQDHDVDETNCISRLSGPGGCAWKAWEHLYVSWLYKKLAFDSWSPYQAALVSSTSQCRCDALQLLGTAHVVAPRKLSRQNQPKKT